MVAIIKQGKDFLGVDESEFSCLGVIEREEGFKEFREKRGGFASVLEYYLITRGFTKKTTTYGEEVWYPPQAERGPLYPKDINGREKIPFPEECLAVFAKAYKFGCYY